MREIAHTRNDPTKPLRPPTDYCRRYDRNKAGVTICVKGTYGVKKIRLGSDRARPLGDHPHSVIDDLQKASVDVEAPVRRSARAAAPEPQLTLTEKCHHRRVVLQNAHLAIERRGYHGSRLTLEQQGLGGDNRDFQ